MCCDVMCCVVMWCWCVVLLLCCDVDVVVLMCCVDVFVGNVLWCWCVVNRGFTYNASSCIMLLLPINYNTTNKKIEEKLYSNNINTSTNQICWKILYKLHQAKERIMLEIQQKVVKIHVFVDEILVFVDEINNQNWGFWFYATSLGKARKLLGGVVFWCWFQWCDFQQLWMKSYRFVRRPSKFDEVRNKGILFQNLKSIRYNMESRVPNDVISITNLVIEKKFSSQGSRRYTWKKYLKNRKRILTNRQPNQNTKR